MVIDIQLILFQNVLSNVKHH